jgi:hypothetical protein
MKARTRYLSALLVNVALPWLAYRIALSHWGNAGALAASMAPLIVWMTWDFAHHRHFDALSAVGLIGTVASLATVLISSETRRHLIEEPLVSGMIGLAFLISLAMPRPLMFYLARSTLTRESSANTVRFDTWWRTRPDLRGHIRLMTLVWGLGLVGENLLRGYLVWMVPSEHRAFVASRAIQYAVYAALTGWTLWYRATRIRKGAGGPFKPD